mgnify:CR=1 FL=1
MFAVSFAGEGAEGCRPRPRVARATYSLAGEAVVSAFGGR